ncbi:hypothetical protein ACQBAT_14490 [Ornithinimicrobium sp. Y1847]|uniref:hypothetical protein n=1 Tax=unclassified Ornithinimicrobium TaxID=2615080 RepID=UPI003B683CC7
MTQPTPKDAWQGTSEEPATIRLRAASSTPEQRLAWLEQSLVLAASSGALHRARARKQADAVARWTGS